MPEKPQRPPDPEEPPVSLPPIQEGPKRRPTGAESTPGGVAAPLGTETFETQPLSALDALLQTNFMETLPGTRPIVGPHSETHMAGGDDEVHSFDTISVYDFILMRKGHETDTGQGAQDEITAPAVPTTQVPQGGGYVTRDIPLVLMESDQSTDPQRIQAVLQPKQGTSGPAGFVQLKSDQTLDASKFAEVGLWGFVAAPSGAVGYVGLYTQAASSHNITPHYHRLRIDPWLHAFSVTGDGGTSFRLTSLRDPVSAQDAATKAYVDALSYAGHALLDGSLHTDSVADAVTAGSIIIGNDTPKWDELVISVPAANVRNVLGVDNGETTPTWKTALDGTSPANIANAASAGTSLVFAHRDHVHAHPAGLTANLHHNLVTIHADAAHALSTQELQAVLAANGQTGHMSGAMFDKLAAIEATADVTDATNVAGAGAVMDSDIAPGEGFLRKTGAGTYTAHKSNLAAGAAPDADEDSADGYSVGSVWIDTTNDDMYVCVDSTEAAAVWLHLNAAAAAHTIVSHSDTTATGTELETLTDGSDADALHDHATLATATEAVTAVEAEDPLSLAGVVQVAKYLELDEIAIPAAPAAGKGRLLAPLLTTNDSLTPGTDKTGLYYRRNDGLMVQVSDDFPYSRKLRHCYSTSPPYGDVDEPNLENSWVNHGYTSITAAFIKDFLGCVWMQGLIKGGTITSSALTLPEGYQDTDGRLMFPSISNAALGRNDLRTDGTVTPETGNNAYVSLMFMAGPVDNRITWHDVGGGGEPAFENNWVNFAGGFTVASFAKDAIGRVWIRGLVKDGNANTTVFTLPAGYRPTADIVRIILVNNNVIGRYIIQSDGSVIVNVLGGANAWATITAVFIADGAATWHEVGSGGGEPAFENSWVNNGGTRDTAAFYKDACGIVHIKGLIKDGTIGQTAFTLPTGYRPKQTLHLPVISSDAIGYMTIDEAGAVKATAGDNGWFTVHCSFIAEQ